MTPYSANPFGFIFSVLAICGVLLYFGYGALDRLGLEVRTTTGIVTGKQFTPSGRSYYTTIAGGREWVQSQQTPETYAVVVTVGNERTAGCVSRQLYEALQPNDAVQVKIRQTRFSRKLEAVEITK